jgi:hypothetical protein
MPGRMITSIIDGKARRVFFFFFFFFFFFQNGACQGYPNTRVNVVP